jgi:hypothetical protein
MGQAKKNRIVCPVTGQPITPPECGSSRISKYNCPESCPQNPWSVQNYDRQLEIFDRMTERCLSRLKEDYSRAGRILSLPAEDSRNAAVLMLFFMNRFFRDRDAQGRTFIERWKANGYPGLNNDQRVLFESQSRLFPAVLEVQQVLDDRQVLAVNRLSADREPILLVDRSLAASACRFTTLLAFLYKTPCFYRMQGLAVSLPDISGMEAEEIVLEVVRHHKGPVKNPEPLREWLFENCQLVIDSFKAVGIARQEALFRNMDAAFTKSVYQLTCEPDEFIKILEAHPDVHRESLSEAEEDEGFTGCWIWTVEGSATGFGRTVLCTILLHEKNHVRLDTSAAKRREQAKPLFEQLFGRKVKFTGERTEDLALQIANQRHGFYDPSLVSEKLIERTNSADTAQTCLPKEFAGQTVNEIMRRTRESYVKTFADTPVPCLDGKTPRQAAACRPLRPKLISLMKRIVRSHDEENLKQGIQVDINGLLRELGLDEINFPPPPVRFRPKAVRDEDFDDEEEDWEDDEDPMILWPEEVQERLEVLKSFEPEELAADFQSAFSEAYDLLQGAIFEEESGIEDRLHEPLMELAATTAFLFFHPSEPIPFISGEQLFENMKMIGEELLSEDGNSLENFSSQPHVMYFVMNRLMELTDSSDDQAYMSVCLFFAGFVHTLHLAFCEKESTGR